MTHGTATAIILWNQKNCTFLWLLHARRNGYRGYHVWLKRPNVHTFCDKELNEVLKVNHHVLTSSKLGRSCRHASWFTYHTNWWITKTIPNYNLIIPVFLVHQQLICLLLPWQLWAIYSTHQWNKTWPTTCNAQMATIYVAIPPLSS